MPVPTIRQTLALLENSETLTIKHAARQDRALDMGFNVDAYHGTSVDFGAFKKLANAHLGFHFGSTPAAANEKLAMDRKKQTSYVNRGDAVQPMYDPNTRDAAVTDLRQRHQALQSELSKIEREIGARAHTMDDAALLDALDKEDEAEITRLLSVGQPSATADEEARIKALRGKMEEVNQRMVAYFERVRPGERVIPVKLRLKNPVRMKDTNWGDARIISNDNRDLRLPPTSLAAIRAELERRGYDGIVYRNDVEDVGQDSYIVFSPTQVRSRFARFNPEKAASGGLNEEAGAETGLPWLRSRVPGLVIEVAPPTADQSSWDLLAGRPRVLVTQQALDYAASLSPEERDAYWFDPFLGIIPHEIAEARLSVELAAGRWEAAQARFPRLEWRSGWIGRLWGSKASPDDLRAYLAGEELPPSLRGIEGVAHEAIVSADPGRYAAWLEAHPIG